MKAIFFDIDGTIISDDGKRYIPQSTKDSIKKLKENGNLTFINTGRVYCNINPMIKELGFDGYLCGCGTNIVLNGEDIFYKEPNRTRCIEIAKLLHNLGFEVLYEHKDGVFFDFSTATETRSLRWKKFFEYEHKDVTRDITHRDFIFDKFIVWLNPNDNRQELVDFLKHDFEPILRCESTGEFFEVVPKGFSKATAIDIVAKRFNISSNDLYTIGDGENDIPMLKAVKNSIAIKGNSAIYRYVSYVTDTLYNDGLSKAMEHFNLISSAHTHA
ncbi:MAG: HAD family hydrolase [Ruminococcus sp.]|nr:HAD family hydrolase [Ruminococcus sp.]